MNKILLIFFIFIFSCTNENKISSENNEDSSISDVIISEFIASKATELRNTFLSSEKSNITKTTFTSEYFENKSSFELYSLNKNIENYSEIISTNDYLVFSSDKIIGNEIGSLVIVSNSDKITDRNLKVSFINIPGRFINLIDQHVFIDIGTGAGVRGLCIINLNSQKIVFKGSWDGRIIKNAGSTFVLYLDTGESRAGKLEDTYYYKLEEVKFNLANDVLQKNNKYIEILSQ